MLYCLPTNAHGLRGVIEALLHPFYEVFMFPACDATFFASRAAFFNGTFMANIGPVSPDCQTLLHGGGVVPKWFSGRADINIAINVISKVLLDEETFLPVSRCHRFRKRRSNIGLIAFKYLLRAKIATVGDDIDLINTKCDLGLLCHRS